MERNKKVTFYLFFFNSYLRLIIFINYLNNKREGKFGHGKESGSARGRTMQMDGCNRKRWDFSR